MDIRSIIQAPFTELLLENGVVLVNPISDDIVLLDSGLDSLGFAILVTRLESDLGFDPFVIMKTPVYPRTFGDFVNIYKTNAPI